MNRIKTVQKHEHWKLNREIWKWSFHWYNRL